MDAKSRTKLRLTSDITKKKIQKANMLQSYVLFVNCIFPWEKHTWFISVPFILIPCASLLRNLTGNLLHCYKWLALRAQTSAWHSTGFPTASARVRCAELMATLFYLQMSCIMLHFGFNMTTKKQKSTWVLRGTLLILQKSEE